MLRKDIEERIKIVEELKNRGINPYPYEYEITHSVREIIERKEELMDKKVKIAGRIFNIRRHGKLIFYDLYDEGNRIQVAVSADKTKNFDIAKRYIQRGDIVGFEGIIGKTFRGELTVFAESFTILSKALISLPDKWFGLQDVEERYRKRYLDILLNDEVRKIFEFRFKAISFIRRFFENLGYIEIETPKLQPIYGGAYAKPFITYVNDLKENWYLSISPELYLKRMLVAGFNKVFEIAKDFRNESIDSNHNPEFTMLEAYEAYANREKMMKIAEELIYSLSKELLGRDYIEFEGKKISLKPPWRRISVKDALREFEGIDVDSLSDEEIKKLLEKHNIQLKTKEYNRGLAITELFESLVEKKLIEPTFVLDHPIESTPLCKPHRKDPSLVERAEAYILGIEIANIYSELNDPITQNKLLLEQAKMREIGFEEAHEYDQDFVEALMYGMPPAGGLGIGVDRVIMILTGAKSLKEVILFPMMKKRTESEAVKILTELTYELFSSR